MVSVLNRKLEKHPAGYFPTECPNCCWPWITKENWKVSGSYRIGGKTAMCRFCGLHLFEVREEIAAQNILYVDFSLGSNENGM